LDDFQTSAAIRRLKHGDIGGLAWLVERYQVRAVRTAYLITYDRATAEDVVQAAFVRVYEKIHQFDAARPFEPWFTRIVVNAAVAAARKHHRTLSLDVGRSPTSHSANGNVAGGEFNFAEFLADDTAQPEKLVEDGEIRNAIREALATLTPDQRAAIVLRYYLGYSEQELAAEFNVAPGTIKWRLHAARKQLGVLLRKFSPAQQALPFTDTKEG
jgi:RNA polymerase sigma-70 factor (ECF subfamily)